MRLRLLPLLMFALAGTVTVKIGSVWNAFEVSVGTESLAQAQPQAPAQPQPAPAAQPASPTPAPEASSAQPAAPAAPTGEAAANQPPPVQTQEPVSSAAPAQQAATTPPPGGETAPAAQPSPAATEPASTAATAPAGEQAPAAEGQAPTDAAAADAAASDEPVPDPFDYTDEEIDVLQQLSKRREELDLRARELDEREALVQAAEQRMDQKMAELKALQATVEDAMKKHSDAQEAELKSLVKTYENMKPKAAAKVFEEMDMDVLLDVAERMNERKLAPILAQVTPTRAKEITFELAQRKDLPIAQ